MCGIEARPPVDYNRRDQGHNQERQHTLSHSHDRTIPHAAGNEEEFFRRGLGIGDGDHWLQWHPEPAKRDVH